MSGVALHHCRAISLLDACATMFDADSGPSKPIAHSWSHAYSCVACCSVIGPSYRISHARLLPSLLLPLIATLATTASRSHAAHGRCQPVAPQPTRSRSAGPLGRRPYPCAAHRSVIAPPSCSTSHLLPLVASPRYHRLATAHRTRPYYAARRTRPQPHAASRTPHAAQLSRIMGTSVCAMPRSVRYAIVASARRRVLCIAWSVRYAHGPLPERM